MNESRGISIAVLTSNQDDVDLVNRTLRGAGHAAHCHWIRMPGDFDRALEAQPLELVILNTDAYPDTVRQVVKRKSMCHPEIPVVALAIEVNETSILEAMNQGACDLVSVTNQARLKAVAARELRACRAERALDATLSSAAVYRRQLQSYMQGSKAAIANVQEGIVTEANGAWAKLFRINSIDDAVGVPVMDLFEPASQAAVKGALIATLQGKWQATEKLLANSSSTSKQATELKMEFDLIEFDDGPFVQMRIEPPEKAAEEPTKLVHEALQRDPTTLFFHRSQFLDQMRRRLSRTPKSGLHVVAFIKLDAFSEIRTRVGYIASEEIISLFAEELRKRLHPRDCAGRFEGTTLMALLERGSDRDAEVWGQQLVDHVQSQVFETGGQKISLTCTVGVCPASSMYTNMEELVAAVADAHDHGRKAGGNRVHLATSTKEDTRRKRYDAIWIKRIRTALAEHRFRLAQLPIAGLRSDSCQMQDMLIRMLDEQQNPILPSEFLPAAERNNLMKTIDRWMISTTIDYCAESGIDRALIRVSRHSLLDPTLVDWIAKCVARRGIAASSLCLQAPEEEAARFIKQMQTTVRDLKKIGAGFALQHYGVDKNRLQILDILQPDFIKIDGELMHSLMSDTAVQEQVSGVVAAAEQRGIRTIAERVESANAMAILFQLGIHFMQGHYVEEPEVVLAEPENTVHTTLEAIAGT